MFKKFTTEQIKSDPIFIEFLKKKNGRKKETINTYVYSLKSFCNYIKKSPKDIHDIHKSDLRENKAEFDMWLTGALDNYVSFLIGLNHSHDGIKNRVSRIKSFLHAFKLRPTPKIDVPKQRVVEDVKYALKVDDIRKAIKHSIPAYQTIFITQAQTGLSISDVLLLDVEDFIFAVSKRGENLSIEENLTLEQAIYRAKKDNNIIGCFDLRRKKTKKEFYTFAGPETLRSIALLLESRNECLSSKSPIFLKINKHLPKEKRNNPQSEDLRLSKDAVENFIYRMHVNRKVFPQIEVDDKKKNYFRSHKLRKWYANQLRFKAGFNAEDTKYLMGQKTGDVLERYINPNTYSALKNNYRKALPYLAINDEIVMEENLEEMERIDNENNALKEELNNLKMEMDAQTKTFKEFEQSFMGLLNDEIKKRKYFEDKYFDKLSKKLEINKKTLKESFYD